MRINSDSTYSKSLRKLTQLNELRKLPRCGCSLCEKEASRYHIIFEETGTELISGTWDSIKARVKPQKLTVSYLGVTKEGIVKFKCTSGTIPGHFWYQEIYFKDLPEALEIIQQDKELTNTDIMRLVISGNLLVHCNDPSYKYFGFQYIGTKRGYALRPERRYPKKRNPNLTGKVCKHLVAVLTVLPFNMKRIIKDMVSKGILDKEWNKKKRKY